MYFKPQFLLFTYYNVIKFCRRNHQKVKTYILDAPLTRKILQSIRASNPTQNLTERNSIKDNIIKDIRNLFMLKKNQFKDKTVRDIKILFDSNKGFELQRFWFKKLF